MPNSGQIGTERTQVSIMLVEDFPVVRDGLRLILESEKQFQLVAETGIADEVVPLVQAQRPDVLLFDLIIDGRDRLDLIRQVTSVSPKTKILVHSMMGESVYAERALKAGAIGYIMKTAPTDEFLLAIQNTSEGRIYLSPKIFVSVFRGSVGRKAGAERQSLLTDRELQVYQMIGAVLPNREIARKLGISVKTVEAHRENIKNKLGLQDAAQLSASASAFIQGVFSSSA